MGRKAKGREILKSAKAYLSMRRKRFFYRFLKGQRLEDFW